MLTQPRLVERPAQTYLAIPFTSAMSELGELAPRRLGELADWMARRSIEAAGPPFYRYVVVDMDRQLTMHIGFPTARAEAGDATVVSGELPGGRYATIRHRGPYNALVDANAALIVWAQAQGLVLAARPSSQGVFFDARIEFYLTDPATEPDPRRWEAEIAILLNERRGAATVVGD